MTTTSTDASSQTLPEYNRTGIDFQRPMPRSKVRGAVIDFHCHLFGRRHAENWFAAADHYGIDKFLSMTPLEDVVGLLRDFGSRIHFIAVPQFRVEPVNWVDDWLCRLESFYNLGSRIMKFHAAPGTMDMRKRRLDHPAHKPMFQFAVDRKMAIMTHIGDPELWYRGKYADTARFGTHEEHFAMWEGLLQEYPTVPWIGAHMGGNPEDLPRLQYMLDKYPQLMLDCSATRWMAREVSARRDPAREFFIRNQDRILFGSDQVSGDDRGFDFLASRFWVHRKLWETAYIGQTPIFDPDLPADQQPILRGLALPDEVLQKLYHDNAAKFLQMIGMRFNEGWG
jgi:predicted TIM-barrel fold metal-dependent hydrolase